MVNIFVVVAGGENKQANLESKVYEIVLIPYDIFQVLYLYALTPNIRQSKHSSIFYELDMCTGYL